jgi:hypothetical protein
MTTDSVRYSVQTARAVIKVSSATGRRIQCAYSVQHPVVNWTVSPRFHVMDDEIHSVEIARKGTKNFLIICYRFTTFLGLHKMFRFWHKTWWYAHLGPLGTMNGWRGTFHVRHAEIIRIGLNASTIQPLLQLRRLPPLQNQDLVTQTISIMYRLQCLPGLRPMVCIHVLVYYISFGESERHSLIPSGSNYMLCLPDSPKVIGLLIITFSP